MSQIYIAIPINYTSQKLIKMKKIYFATRVRGFFVHLFAEPSINAEISYSKNSIYELNNKKEKIIRILAKLSIFDMLGVIKTVKVKNMDCDIYGSFNRFLNVDKPYFVYVENPTALYHYRLNRVKSFLGFKKVCKKVNDYNLKYIICMSQACKKTFEKLCCKVENPLKLIQIYPLVPENIYINENIIRNRSYDDKIKLLYIAQGIRFFSKGGLEVLHAYKRLKEDGNMNISLTVVTSKKDVSTEILSQIESIDGVTLLDFKLSYEEMQKLYASHNIFLMPSSDDSFNLTVLEAIKSGLPVLGSNLYAIPEMVEDAYNGYLTEPAYYFFDKNCMPNPLVWNRRKQTIYSGQCNENVSTFLYEKIKYMINNRDVLCNMSINSLYRASSKPFSKAYIIEQWNNILYNL